MIKEESSVADWLALILNKKFEMGEAKKMSSGSGSRVYECSLRIDGIDERAVLKIYGKDFENYSNLGIIDSVKKNILVFQQLPEHGIRTPELLGYAHGNDKLPSGGQVGAGESAILMKKIESKTWEVDTRNIAAVLLAKLHNLSVDKLSKELSSLIERSTKNRQRIFNGVNRIPKLDARFPGWRKENPGLYKSIVELIESGEPIAKSETIIHGDYFSVNIMLEQSDVRVIDWDLVSLGDPMWDLGFLVGADKNVTETEADKVIETYRAVREIDEYNLAWHRKCWSAFWQIMKLGKK